MSAHKLKYNSTQANADNVYTNIIYMIKPKLQLQLQQYTIGLLLFLIVVALAVVVSVIRSQMQFEEVVSVEPVIPFVDVPNNEEVLSERMQRMHEVGDASTTPAQLERMKEMNAQSPELTDDEEGVLLERMRAMRDAS